MSGIKNVLAVIILLGVTGASSYRSGEAVQVKIGDLAFTPGTVTVHVGDTVEWVNADFIDHTATEADGAWDLTIEAGRSALLKLDRAGDFRYYCRYHPGMTGHLTVTAGPRDASGKAAASEKP